MTAETASHRAGPGPGPGSGSGSGGTGGRGRGPGRPVGFPGAWLRLVAAFAFTAVVWRSLSRDRMALFFLLVLPVAVMVVTGAAFGGAGSITVAVVREGDGLVTTAIEDRVSTAAGLRERAVDTVRHARDQLRRGDVDAVLVLPAGLDAAVIAAADPSRVSADDPGEVEVLTDLGSDVGMTARTTLAGIVQDTAATFTATAVSARLTGAPVAEIAGDLARTAPPVAVASRDVGAGAGVEPNRFSEVAPRNLILFVFINSLASAAFIVSVRRSGVLHRAASTRSGVPALLAGLVLGWLVLALVQSALIVAVGAFAFGVDWGDPLAGGLLLLAFAGVGCGGGLVVGAIGRDPERTSSITPFVGIVLGAIGGCMVPLEFFPPAIDAVAHVTPHYWAVTGWDALIIDGAGLADVGVNLAVLAVMAVALSATAAAILRHQLARG
ncbi:ABC transporter permease [Frankia sp. Mgl5]|uniref:ABC transporter permease n=1 Tax=Frankia sp. Mgl5 TaxID=2933793 RepID=UPI00200DD418|nr:ABC transporter permease [Frankia sp. Mgl5]MCK9926016.1 ABC transporter permease [Frankia sp. Mgl5]